jgi:predicted dehydrogenase
MGVRVQFDRRLNNVPPEIDVVDIASPNDKHAEITIAAAQAGKTILCDKPLARNLEEAHQMVDAAKKAGVRTMVWYNYRTIAGFPHWRWQKEIIASGKLGRIFHYRASFYKIGRSRLMCRKAGWRLDVNVAGIGVTGDLLARCIDTAIWLNGAPLAMVRS